MTWLVTRIDVKHGQSQWFVFPNHAKHSCLTLMSTRAAECKRCEQMHNHQLGTRPAKAEAKVVPCTLPFPAKLDSLFVRFAALRMHRYGSNQSQVAKRTVAP